MMRNLKFCVRIFWYLYQIVLIFNQVECGTKRDLFDCISVHVCKCDLYEEYNKCYWKGPLEARKKSLALMNEILSAEYTLDQGPLPLRNEVCSEKDKDAKYETFQKWEKEMRKYEIEVQGNPLLVKDQMKMHEAKNCFMPYMARCMEFGDQCG
ncbi:hypothetical protein TNCV_2438321 [Trichonephila clavipes]|nr:hypothetical protein TNCV_2438321 [Trichonephila clavipes]